MNITKIIKGKIKKNSFSSDFFPVLTKIQASPQVQNQDHSNILKAQQSFLMPFLYAHNIFKAQQPHQKAHHFSLIKKPLVL